MSQYSTESIKNQEEFRAAIKSFSTAAGQNYPSSPGVPGYAYQAGYLGSLCVELLSHLPEHLQRRHIEDMNAAAEKQRREIINRNDRTYESYYASHVF